jgi:undecaprenyl-diphosphatase
VDDIIKAIVLGAVQGLTEFIPVSSSAHLVLVPWFLGWDTPGLSFDVALHIGTLFAVLFYFRQDWARMTVAFLFGLKERKFADFPDRRVALLVAVGTIPAVVIGYFARSFVEADTQNPPVVAVELILSGVILLATLWPRGQRRADQMSFLDAILIGLGQALAIIPGISRSGSTITVGLYRGLSAPEAARYSFLLSAPVIVGAALVEVPHLLHGEAGEMSAAAIIIGIVTAAAFGLLAIHFMLRILAHGTMLPFAIYCFAIGLVGVAYFILN